MSSWWKTWGEINLATKNKTIVFYGRSEDWIPKTLPKILQKPAYIVDRSTAYLNTEYMGLPVELPERIFREDRDKIFIIITSGSYEGILSFLTENGFEAGRHFCCCPEYKDWCLLEEMRNYEQEVFISCSDYNDKTKTRYSRRGGGIYRYSIGPNEVSLLQKGSFRQFVQAGDLIYAVEYEGRKLYVFDKKFKVLDTNPLEESNNCGLAYNKKRNVLFVVNAGQDTISIHEPSSFKQVEKIYYSDKKDANVRGHHHLNDICASEDYIFVSYFSHSGNYKHEVYDGGISEYHIDRLNEPPVRIVQGLWKPHSPEIIHGDLCYLDSMRGRFHTNSQIVAGEFSGFVRGLAYDGRFYYVGQSEDMYVTKRFGVAGNVMLNAGFHMFDINTKASRFYPMLDNMNIHDLLILED